MANFEWVCHDCNLILEGEYSVGKAPNKKKCIKCNKLVGRYYASINVSFNNDLDFHTVKQRYQKHADKGFDKDAANTFLKHAINHSKIRMNEQEHMYKPATLDYKKLHKDGLVKKLSQREQSEKIERARKLTGEAYDKAKLDIKKPQKQQ